MPKTAIIALAALIIASTAALAGIIAAFADGEPRMDENGRRLDCIPASHANAAGDCLWTPELTKIEVNVEFEYPYCEVKLEVESNLDELPDGVSVRIGGERYTGDIYPRAHLIYVQSDDTVAPLARDKNNNPQRRNYSGISYASDWDIRAYYPNWEVKTIRPGESGRATSPFRYKSDQADWFRTLTDRVVRNLPQTTLGRVYMSVVFEYSGEFAKPKRVGNAVKSHGEVSPVFLRTNTIPISHTFAGLFDEMATCLEVAKREEERATERVALESQKAGLRQSLALLKSELTRARQHELDATGILKEVIDVSEKVEEMLRTIQRVRVEGLAERRQIIETYYSEESQRYSVFIQSLEGSQAALAAADAAIAARKAELEASRAELERIVAEAQAAEADLIAEIEEAEKALGNDEE